MHIRSAVLAFVLVATFDAAAAEYAHACSCMGSRDETVLMAEAEYVVRGKVTAMRAGADVTLKMQGWNGRIVAGTLKVDQQLKGDLAGEIEILTGFGTGDCGVPGLLLTSIAWDRQIDVQLRKAGTKDRSYFIEMCGISKLRPHADRQ